MYSERAQVIHLVRQPYKFRFKLKSLVPLKRVRNLYKMNRADVVMNTNSCAIWLSKEFGLQKTYPTGWITCTLSCMSTTNFSLRTRESSHHRMVHTTSHRRLHCRGSHCQVGLARVSKGWRVGAKAPFHSGKVHSMPTKYSIPVQIEH